MENTESRKKKAKWILKSGQWKLESIIESIKQAEPEKEKSLENSEVVDVIESSSNLRPGIVVSTCWGEGKLNNIKENGMAEVRIEGNEIELPVSELNPHIQLYFLILKESSSMWADLQFEWDTSVTQMKVKVAEVADCHPSQVVLIHNEKKLPSDFMLLNAKVYKKDRFLAVINDSLEFRALRSCFKQIYELQRQRNANAVQRS